jgi:hypothetical protein
MLEYIVRVMSNLGMVNLGVELGVSVGGGWNVFD